MELTRRPPEPDIHLDVINGWPLNRLILSITAMDSPTPVSPDPLPLITLHCTIGLIFGVIQIMICITTPLGEHIQQL